jgi:hypothetical protein
MAKATFNKVTLFTQKLNFSLRKRLANCYIWSIALYGAETGTLESRSEISGSFEMWCWRRRGKIFWTDHVRNEEVEERNIPQTIKGKKANWIGHILHRNCLLKHAVERKVDRRSEGEMRKKM